jgi:hypothetical protein
MTTPLGKLDLLAAYALAFGLTALVQVAVVATISLTWLGRAVAGSGQRVGLAGCSLKKRMNSALASGPRASV